MARLTAEIMNGQRVVEVENADEFFYYLKRGPVTAPPGLGESLGFTDALSPEEWEEELQKEWSEEDRPGEPPMEISSPFSQRSTYSP